MSSDHWAIMMSMDIVVKTGSNEKSHRLVSKQLLWKRQLNQTSTSINEF